MILKRLGKGKAGIAKSAGDRKSGITASAKTKRCGECDGRLRGLIRKTRASRSEVGD